MRKKWSEVGKGFRMASAVLLLCGLTACANPLTNALKVAMDSFSEQTETEEGEIETRAWEVRKIEPDIRRVEENGEEITNEIIDEAVPLESISAADEH